MQKPDRDDIHILSRNSNWSEAQVEQQLKRHVYSNTADWQRFLQVFFIGLGICFTTAGIVFFFAYNWDDLGKFAKMGLVGSSLVALLALVLFSKGSQLIKNILLTGGAMLVGPLFAVYGQIYQTGADTYELFNAWVLGVTVWVLVAGFAPLWLFYIGLVNTTLMLYLEQTTPDMKSAVLGLIFYALNVFFLLGSLALNSLKAEKKAPDWFTNTLALYAVGIATTGASVGVFDDNLTVLPLLFVLAATYALALWYGAQVRRVFYFAIIPFSVIIILSAAAFNASTDTAMFLLVSLFIIGGVTLTIKLILNLQKKWADA